MANAKPEPYLEQGPESLEDRRAKDEWIERKQELDDVRDILAMPAGVRLFRRILAKGRVFGTTYTGNANGYFLEGQRNLALVFLRDVFDAAPAKVPEILTPEDENQGDEENG